MSKHKRKRDNSRYSSVQAPLNEQSYEVNDTRVGTLLSVPVEDLKKLGLMPEWDPCAFISRASFKSARGKYAFLRGDDIKVFKEVYELATGVCMRTHPKGNDYPVHTNRLIPFDAEVSERPVPDLPAEIPYSCDEVESDCTDVAVYNPILQSVTDFVMYVVLCDIMDNHQVQGPKLLETKYIGLRTWIRAKTPALRGTFYDDRTRMMWVYQFRTSFPVCPTCHREYGRMKNIHLSKTYVAYQPHCSSRCARTDPRVISGYRASCMERFGVDHPSKSKAVREKTKKTLIERYGSDNLVGVKSFREKAIETSRGRYGTDYPAQNPKIRAKVDATMEKRYGTSYSMLVPEFKEKAIKTMRSKYGVDHPLQSAELNAKALATRKKRYGVEYPAQDPDMMDRMVKARIRNRRLENRPQADGLVFDSRWELEFYEFCKSHGLDVEYHPCRFEYSCGGKTHMYYPDFRVGGRLYEIKGDCFINVDGTWRSPFRRDGSSDEEYASECAKMEAKRQCIISHGVVVISGNEMKNLEGVVRE